MMGAMSREMAGPITVMNVILIFIPSVPWKKTKMILWEEEKIPKKGGSVMGKSAPKLDRVACDTCRPLFFFFFFHEFL